MKYPQLVSMPSAVSDWLEEQLEARGIDAVVYTRYILSLFHRDSLDFFGSESDQQSKVKLGGSRKRLRRSAECCNHVHVNAEQLKRSAAVECLMSASDQNTGIETLVDELCEKLKEIERNNSSAAIDKRSETETEQSQSSVQQQQLSTTSPNDLANKYYAAFPALSQNTANLITLIPKWFGSPNKKKAAAAAVAAARKNAVQKRSFSCDENLHSKSESDAVENNMKPGGRHPTTTKRLSYFSRNKKELGYSRTMAKSLERAEGLADWDVYMYERNGDSGDIGSAQNADDDDDAKRMEANLVAKFDPSLEDLWRSGAATDAANMETDTYEGLPVDIQDLLASPSPQDVSVELLNWANKQDLNSKRSFIQCGTNITSSIWSDSAAAETDDDFDKSLYENLYNGALEEEFRGKFSLWSDDNSENDENKAGFSLEYFGDEGDEQQQTRAPQWDYSYVAAVQAAEKWSDAAGDLDTSYKFVSDSLLKLNHDRELSCFTEVVPKATDEPAAAHAQPPLRMNLSELSAAAAAETGAVDEEEDLLTSTLSHFRPINSATSAAAAADSSACAAANNNGAGAYVDGTTFVIPSNLEQVNYKRSTSGTMYLESETGGSPKKIVCYKNDRRAEPPPEIWSFEFEPEFVLKFAPCSNDKSCQTDQLLLLENAASAAAASAAEEMNPIAAAACAAAAAAKMKGAVKAADGSAAKSRPLDDFFFPGDEELLNNNVENCEFYATECAAARADSMTAEIIWDGGEKKCDKCKINDWAKNKNKSFEASKGRNIWNVEVCGDCLGVTAGRAPSGRSLQYCQLREELSQDGEQLLSDLSCLQRVYMENATDTDSWQQCSAEENPASSWSNFAFVKKDCILEVPTLRSVTL